MSTRPASFRIGIDLGGTKIEAVALDEAGEVRLRERIATPRAYAASLDALAELVRRIERQLGLDLSSPASSFPSVGVSMPGAVSRATGLVKNANSTWLNGRPFAADLSTRLARPVGVANDADCFALSEAVDGAGAGHRMVFGVILGTGVGGGLVFDRQVWHGRNAIAGEWGHDALPRVTDGDRPLPDCWCGRNGCIETYLSGPALLADHRRCGGIAEDAADVAARAVAGAPSAVATMTRYQDRLARALAMVVNVLDPDIVVLGGGLSNIDALYAHLPERVAREVFSDTFETPIVRNRHGDSSGVRGAAWLRAPADVDRT